MVLQRKCWACYYWKVYTPSLRHPGCEQLCECHAKSPVIFEKYAQPAIWPQTMGDDYCGDFFPFNDHPPVPRGDR